MSRWSKKTADKLDGWVRRNIGVKQSTYGRASLEEKDKIRERFMRKPYE